MFSRQAECVLGTYCIRRWLLMITRARAGGENVDGGGSGIPARRQVDHQLLVKNTASQPAIHQVQRFTLSTSRKGVSASASPLTALLPPIQAAEQLCRSLV
jgi:hypothetical protein